MSNTIQNAPKLNETLDAADGNNDGNLSADAQDLKEILESPSTPPEQKILAIQKFKELEGVEATTDAKLDEIIVSIADAKMLEIAGGYIKKNGEINFGTIPPERLIEMVEFLDEAGLLEHNYAETFDIEVGGRTIATMIANYKNADADPATRAANFSALVIALTETFNSETSIINSKALGSIEDGFGAGESGYEKLNANAAIYAAELDKLRASSDMIPLAEQKNAVGKLIELARFEPPGSNVTASLEPFKHLYDAKGNPKGDISDAEFGKALDQFREDGGLGDGLGSPTFGRLLDLQNQKVAAIMAGDMETAASLAPQISVMQMMMQAILSAL